MVRGFDTAMQGTFQQDLTATLDKMTNWVHHTPVRWFTPFIKTPLNLARTAWNMTPGINLMVPAIEKIIPDTATNGFANMVRSTMIVKDLAAGGAKAQAAKGMLTLTNGAFLGLLLAPTEGIITGNGGLPMSNKTRTSYPEYYIFNPKTGQSWYYGDNIMLRIMIGIPISLKEMIQQVDWEDDTQAEDMTKLIQGTVALMSDALLNNVYFTRFSEAWSGLHEAIFEQNTFALMKTANQLAMTAMLPYSGLASFISGTLDPYQREIESSFDVFKRKFGLGMMTDGMSYALDMFGNPRKRTLTRPYEPIDMSRLDPVTREIRFLNPGILDVPTSHTLGDMKGVKYTEQERNLMRYYMRTGETMGGVPIYNALEKLMMSPEYRAVDNATKRIYVKNVWDRYRESVQIQLDIDKNKAGIYDR